MERNGNMTDKQYVPTMFNEDGTPVSPEHKAQYEAELAQSLKDIFNETE